MFEKCYDVGFSQLLGKGFSQMPKKTLEHELQCGNLWQHYWCLQLEVNEYEGLYWSFVLCCFFSQCANLLSPVTHTQQANRLSHRGVAGGWRKLKRSRGWKEQQRKAKDEMDDAVGCVKRTQGILVFFTSVALMLPHSSLYVCCVCVCEWAECQLQVWKTGAASWAFYTDQHQHTPHKAGMWETDRQRPAPTNTLSVYVEYREDIFSCLSILYPSPKPIIAQLLFFFWLGSLMICMSDVGLSVIKHLFFRGLKILLWQNSSRVCCVFKTIFTSMTWMSDLYIREMIMLKKQKKKSFQKAWEPQMFISLWAYFLCQLLLLQSVNYVQIWQLIAIVCVPA